MLAADKLLLQSSIRQNSIALKEKEFNLHHGNFNAVGTQAAVLAGFTVTACADAKSRRPLRFEVCWRHFGDVSSTRVEERPKQSSRSKTGRIGRDAAGTLGHPALSG